MLIQHETRKNWKDTAFTNCADLHIMYSKFFALPLSVMFTCARNFLHKYRFTYVKNHLCMYILTTSTANGQENFQTNSAVDTNNTMNNQHLHNKLSTSDVFREVHIMLEPKFSTICHLVSKVVWMKRKKNSVALRLHANYTERPP
jgi:hypothetical protein